MTDVDAALVQQIRDVPKGQRDSNVYHDRQAEDFPARPEVLDWGAVTHPVTR